LRAETTTCAPAARKASAQAKPMPVDAPTNQTRRPDHSVIGAFSCNQPRAWAFEDEAFDVVGPTLGIAGSATTVAATVAAPVVTKCASVTGRFM
jgi:hypothetical protein